jgi:uncharacterized membrane protein
MVEYCVWKRYTGPICYEITAEERKMLQIFNIIILILMLIIIISIIVYSRNKETKSVSKNPIAFFVILFVVMIVVVSCYEIKVTRNAELLCSGVYDCSGRRQSHRNDF